MNEPTIPAPSKLVAVAIPLSTRPTLSPDEEISLRHAAHYLGRYDKYMVSPMGLPVNFAGFGAKRFPRKYFGSVAAHARLVTSRTFYEAFADYQYILMYHLDSLVFSDQLEQWCQTNLDYIGPPWINCADSPWVDKERVGNNGFALMKVESFLKVLYSTRRSVDPEQHWREHYASKPRLTRCLNLPRRYLKRLPIFNSLQWQLYRWLRSSTAADALWADWAVRYNPDFKIADVATGLRFAFEVAPRLCFERNHQQMPFGCHAWPRYDRAFWEPYLLKDDLAENKHLVATQK